MANINSLISNPYLVLFIVSLIVVGLDVVSFLERVKKKVKQHNDFVNLNLKKHFQRKKIGVLEVVGIYDNLVRRDDKINQVKANISMNLWSGIIFLISCLIGAIFNGNPNGEGIAFFGLLISGFAFFLSLISLIYFHVKN